MHKRCVHDNVNDVTNELLQLFLDEAVSYSVTLCPADSNDDYLAVTTLWMYLVILAKTGLGAHDNCLKTAQLDKPDDGAASASNAIA